jgi:hypothetical protein
MADDGEYILPELPGLPPKDMAGPFSWCNWVIGRQVVLSLPPNHWGSEAAQCSVLTQCSGARKLFKSWLPPGKPHDQEAVYFLTGALTGIFLHHPTTAFISSATTGFLC